MRTRDSAPDAAPAPGTYSRRGLLAAGAGGIAALSAGAGAARPASAAPERPWRGFDRAIVINALGDVNDPNVQPIGGRDEGPYRRGEIDRRVATPRAIRDLRRSGVTAVCVTLGGTSPPGDAFEHAVRHIGVNDAMIRANRDSFVKVLASADILDAKARGRTGLIYGFQNSQMVGDDVRRIDILANLGVRALQLTYNTRNAVGDGSAVKDDRGLTKLGLEVVERLNANRVLVDAAHGSERTCLQAIAASRQPIAISHTGCRALADMPRNKTDAELRLLADRGGVVGIYFFPFLRLDGRARAADLVAHIEHAVKVCGEDHVGIGTDFNTTGIDDVEKHRAEMNALTLDRQRKGIAAPGEQLDVVLFLPDLAGPDQYRRLADRLHARGHPSRRIEKILGGNFLRLYGDVWGG